jgi:hypothetical protein
VDESHERAKPLTGQLGRKQLDAEVGEDAHAGHGAPESRFAAEHWLRLLVLVIRVTDYDRERDGRGGQDALDAHRAPLWE